MMQRLGTSSEYFEKTTENLYEITSKLNKSESLWALLSDSVLTNEIKMSVSQLNLAASKAAALANTGSQFMYELKAGEGVIQKLFTDAQLADELTVSLEKIRVSSNQASQVVDQVNALIDSLEAGEGTIGLLLKDPSFREALSNTMLNLEMSTERFNENMEAMRSNFLFRRYFRRLEREKSEEVGQ